MVAVAACKRGDAERLVLHADHHRQHRIARQQPPALIQVPPQRAVGALVCQVRSHGAIPPGDCRICPVGWAAPGRAGASQNPGDRCRDRSRRTARQTRSPRPRARSAASSPGAAPAALHEHGDVGMEQRAALDDARHVAARLLPGRQAEPGDGVALAAGRTPARGADGRPLLCRSLTRATSVASVRSSRACSHEASSKAGASRAPGACRPAASRQAFRSSIGVGSGCDGAPMPGFASARAATASRPGAPSSRRSIHRV